MTFAPEPRKLKPGEKRKKIVVGEFEKYRLPAIRGKKPSAVDQLAALVDENARKRVERYKRGIPFAKLSNSAIASVLPMTRGSTFAMKVTYRRRSR